MDNLTDTKCVWCGRLYKDHSDNPSLSVTPRMPCGGLKSGFLSNQIAVPASLAYSIYMDVSEPIEEGSIVFRFDQQGRFVRVDDYRKVIEA